MLFFTPLYRATCKHFFFQSGYTLTGSAVSHWGDVSLAKAWLCSLWRRPALSCCFGRTLVLKPEPLWVPFSEPPLSQNIFSAFYAADGFFFLSWWYTYIYKRLLTCLHYTLPKKLSNSSSFQLSFCKADGEQLKLLLRMLWIANFGTEERAEMLNSPWEITWTSLCAGWKPLLDFGTRVFRHFRNHKYKEV